MTEANNVNGRANGCEVSALGSLTSGSVRKLRSHWINTVEQFVSAAATEKGFEGLKNLLADENVSLDAILRESRVILGAQHYDALMQAKPGGPLGARFDDPKGGAS